MTSSALCFVCDFVQPCVAGGRVCPSVCVCARECFACAHSPADAPSARARRHALAVRRWDRQAPDGRRAAEGDDGNLAQSLPEDPGLAGHAAQV